MQCRRRRRVVLLSLALVAVLLPVGTVGAFAVGTPGVAAAESGRTLSTASSVERPTTDNTVTRIELASNGSATWIVRVRTRLETDQEVENYRAFQQSFRENRSTYLDPFRQRILRVVAAAENETGRTMRATNFRASTSIQEVPRRWGVVTYRFRWSNFAAVTDGRVVVGDVFAGGFYLAENDTLEIVAPPGHAVVTVEPEPDKRDGGTVTWLGPVSFADGRPRVVTAPAGQVSTAAGTSGTTGGLPSSMVVPLVGAGIVAVGAVGFLAYRRRARSGVDESGSEAAEESQEPTVEAPETSAAEAPPPEPELVTDEEQVLDLLERAGGRVRQADIADELDWSASKTSRVLSRMADEGDIEKLRLGRENVVRLPESE